MARPREFQMDEATERAMALFWSGGYEEVSLADLLDAMRLSRGSLYKAYGEKQGVWLAALDLYDNRVVQPAAQALADAGTGPGLARVTRFLEAPAAAFRDGDDRRGCFLCNAAVDRAASDGNTRERVLAMFMAIEQGLQVALADAAADRGWSVSTVDKKAKATLAAYVGLRVLVRAGFPRDTIDLITATHIETLSGP